MFPQVYFTHPCSAVGRSVNRAAEADDAIRAPGTYILAYEQVACGQLAYSGDADEFRFEPGGVLPRGCPAAFRRLCRSASCRQWRRRIARAPVGPVPGRTRVDDVFFRAPFFEPSARCSYGFGIRIVSVVTGERSSSETATTS